MYMNYYILYFTLLLTIGYRLQGVQKLMERISLPLHLGREFHIPLAKQDTVADPERMYPLSQL